VYGIVHFGRQPLEIVRVDADALYLDAWHPYAGHFAFPAEKNHAMNFLYQNPN
jgi:hypothetical protein